jgi:hypothetical protein
VVTWVTIKPCGLNRIDSNTRAGMWRGKPDDPGSTLSVRDDPRRHLMASGLVGEPTAPVMGIAGATNMNS